jgi:two-component system NarL family response regulator
MLASTFLRAVSGSTPVARATVSCIPAELVAKLVAGMTSEGLTDRELEVLKLVARGMSNKEVATTLTISETTVKTHLRAIFAKLGVLSRTEAIAAASRRGRVQL